MTCKPMTTSLAIVIFYAHLVSTRRVQTEYLIHHPIHANNQKALEDEASSFIDRSQGESATLESKSSDAQTSVESRTNKDKDRKSTTMWEWLSSGEAFMSLVLAVFRPVSPGGDGIPIHDMSRYIYCCSLAMFLAGCVACTCRVMEWWKTRPGNKRNQYKHHGRVIYEWIQTSEAITFFTKLPPGQGQESLEVKLWPKHAKFGRKGKVPFIKEGLYDAVNVDKCSWNVSREGELVIILVKEMEQQWPCVFAAHHPDKAVCDRGKSDKSHRYHRTSSSSTK